MTTKHTPAPWSIFPLNPNAIRSESDGFILAMTTEYSHGTPSQLVSEADARHIVKCVNNHAHSIGHVLAKCWRHAPSELSY